MKLFRNLSSWICCNTVNTNCILNPTLVKDLLTLIKKDPSPDVNQASCRIICSSTKGRVTGIVWGKPAFNFWDRPVLILPLLFTIFLIPVCAS